MNTPIGAAIHRERDRRRLSQRKAADRYFHGMSGTSLGRWETGETSPGMGRVAELSEFLGLPPNEVLSLITGQSEQPASLADVTGRVSAIERDIRSLRADLDTLVAMVAAATDATVDVIELRRAVADFQTRVDVALGAAPRPVGGVSEAIIKGRPTVVAVEVDDTGTEATVTVLDDAVTAQTEDHS